MVAGPKTRKPPEGGSAKGARKAPEGSVQGEQVAEARDERHPAERAYDRALAALREAGYPLPADPALRWTAVSIFAERYAVEDLGSMPELLWECIEEARTEFLPKLTPELRSQLGRSPKRPVFIFSARPHSSRRESRRRSVRSGPRKARAPGSQADEDPHDLIRLKAASARLWAHVRRREARQRLVA